jgi:hypothetical protein
MPMQAAPRPYWIKWGHGSEYRMETPPLVAGDPSLALPLMLAVSESGSSVALAVTQADPNTGVSQVYTSGFNGSSWQAAQRVGDVNYARANFPDYASDGDGGWASLIGLSGAPNGKVMSIKAIVGKAGDTVMPPPMPMPASAPGTGPSVASIALTEGQVGGTAVVMDSWRNVTALLRLGNDADATHLYTLRYDGATRRWSEPARVSEQVVVACDLTVTDKGEPVAVWLERTPASDTEGQLMTARVDGAGAWLAAQPIGQPISLNSANVVKAAMNAAGELLVAWTQASDLPDGTPGRALAARHSDASGAFSEPSTIATVGGDLSVVGLTWSDRDAAIVVWSESDAGSQTRNLKWAHWP